MSPAPVPQISANSAPYTVTNSVDTASFASIAATFSNNMDPTSRGSMSISPEQSSIFASLGGAFQSTITPLSSGVQSTTLATSKTATSSLPSSNAVVTSSGAAASSQSTPTSSQSLSVSSPAVTTSAVVASASSASPSSTASSAANNSSSELQAESNGGMSSPGIQAAVAVPIVVVVLAAIALIFFFMRRKRQRRVQPEEPAEKAALVSRSRGWTRHLKVFSFDTELLMGGRYSSTNSVRSRQTGSVRSNAHSAHSGSPSMHSVDEVAPPYKDAITAAQPPNSMAQVLTGATAGSVAITGVNRSASNATAPPPYGVAAGRLATPTSPAIPPPSHRSTQNPFADSAPVSPIEVSPFNDPPETSPPVSRNSSLYRSDRDDASTIGGASDAISIREATLARNASVMSGARLIHNTNR